MNAKKLVLSAVIVSVSWGVQAEQIPSTELSVHLESAYIVGSGTTLNMLRVPIVDVNTRAVNYYDVIFKFTLDSSNQITLERLSSITANVPMSSDIFIPGTYVGAEGYKYKLSGSSIAGEIRQYSLVNVNAPGNTAYFEVNFSGISGNPGDNPAIGGRDIVEQLIPGLAYGAAGSIGSYTSAHRSGFKAGDLIGASFTVDGIAIYGFTEEGKDYSYAKRSVTYRLETPDQ